MNGTYRAITVPIGLVLYSGIHQIPPPPPQQSRKPYINSVRFCFAHPMNHAIVVTNSHMVFLAPRFIKSC